MFIWYVDVSNLDYSSAHHYCTSVLLWTYTFCIFQTQKVFFPKVKYVYLYPKAAKATFSAVLEARNLKLILVMPIRYIHKRYKLYALLVLSIYIAGVDHSRFKWP